MMEEDMRFLSLLLQQKELVFKLLRMTNDTALAEADVAATAERYIELVAAREGLINEIEKLNVEMASLREPAVMSWEAGLLRREIREMIGQIARLETELREKAVDIMSQLQQEINNMNNRKKISDAYDSANFYGG